LIAHSDQHGELVPLYEFKYTENAIDWASENGHVHILDWFDRFTRSTDASGCTNKNTRYEFKYTKNAINEASKNGHENIVEWFAKYNAELK